MIATVLSVDPPSQTVTSSGTRVCSRMDANKRLMFASSLNTVIAREIRMCGIITWSGIKLV